MFGPPRMTSAEDWIEVWVDERKERDLFEQEFACVAEAEGPADTDLLPAAITELQQQQLGELMGSESWHSIFATEFPADTRRKVLDVILDMASSYEVFRTSLADKKLHVKKLSQTNVDQSWC